MNAPTSSHYISLGLPVLVVAARVGCAMCRPCKLDVHLIAINHCQILCLIIKVLLGLYQRVMYDITPGGACIVVGGLRRATVEPRANRLREHRDTVDARYHVIDSLDGGVRGEERKHHSYELRQLGIATLPREGASKLHQRHARVV